MERARDGEEAGGMMQTRESAMPYEPKEWEDVVNMNGVAATREEVAKLFVERGYTRLFGEHMAIMCRKAAEPARLLTLAQHRDWERRTGMQFPRAIPLKQRKAYAKQSARAAGICA